MYSHSVHKFPKLPCVLAHTLVLGSKGIISSKVSMGSVCEPVCQKQNN